MIYLFEDIRVDVKRLRVERGNRPIELEPKAFRVLLHLIEHRDRVVTKEELIAGVWAGTFVTDNAVTRVIAQIRKQLGDNARSPRLIETAATAGYRFIATVIEPSEASAEAVVSPAPWMARSSIVALVLAFFASLMWWTRPAPSSAGSPLRRIEQITSSAAADLWPTFSPDDRQMAFSSNRTGHFEIYIRSLADGGAERQITSDGRENIQPAWSPDGRYLAFVTKTRGGIAVMPAGGGQVRYVTDAGTEPQWSPDGQTLVYRSTNLNTIREAMAWDAHLMLVGLDGSAPRMLTEPGRPHGGHNHPRWLPDGEHVIFSAPGDRSAQAPWVVDVRTGALDRQLGIDINTVTYPTLTRDASYLYFVGAGVREPMGLWRARLDRKWSAQPPEAISAATVAWPRDLAITADGSRIAFSQEMVESAIWSVPVDRSGVETGDSGALTGGHSLRDSAPVFSADGTKLAYTSSKHGGKVMVYVADADGSSPKAVSPGDRNSFDPDWAGDAFAYQTASRNGTAYWLTAPDGPPKELKLKLDPERIARLHLSPDGTRMLAQTGSPDRYQLVLEDLRRGTVQTITPLGRSIGFPVWSPDGKWIAAQERVAGTTRLVILPAGGGEIRTLVSEPVESWANAWSPDGDRIAFAGLRNGVWNIYWVSRSTGMVRQLTRFTSQSTFVRYPTWSPKGNQVAFEYNRLEANIYVGDLR